MNFDFGSVNLTKQVKAQLKQLLAGFLNQVAPKSKIIGHADNSGDEKSNITLSEQRAQAVRDALVANGIRQERSRLSGRANPYQLQTTILLKVER